MEFISRKFNKLILKDAYSGIIRKESKDEKLLDEINYYIHMPMHFKKYFPRLFSYNDSLELGPYYIELEYYTYPTLSSLLYQKLDISRWSKIFSNLSYLLNDFKIYERDNKTGFQEIYLNKNKTRLEWFIKSSNIDYLNMDKELKINGKLYPPINSLFSLSEKYLNEISINGPKEYFIHGDLCFSNILCSYDERVNLLKLIDPRGRFTYKGYYGDTRYDIAKLSHSINSGYDLILNERYSLTVLNKNNLTFDFDMKKFLSNKLKNQFKNDIIEKYGFNYKEIRLIEAWLFLSMLPLHYEDIKRQTAFLITGLNILRELKII